MIADGSGHATHSFQVLAVVGGIPPLLDFTASSSESLDSSDGFLGIGFQRLVSDESLQIGLCEIGEQGLAMGAAVNGNVLPGLPRYGDDVRGTGVIDEKRAPAFTDCQVRSFIRKRCETLEVIMRDSRQHVAPIILTGQT